MKGLENNPYRVGVVSVAYIGLTFLFPLLLIDFFLPEWNVYMLLPWACIFYSMSKIAYLGCKNEKRFMEMTFLLFVLVWLGFSPFCQISANHFPWLGRYYEFSDLIKAYAIIGTGIIFYELGLLYKKRKIPFATATVQKSEENESKSLQLKPLMVLSFVILLFTSFLISKYGGFSMFLHSRGESGVYYGSKMESLIVSNLIKVPPLVILLYVLVYWKQRSKMSKPFLLILMTLILFIVNLYISNPVFNPRYWFGTVALALCFMIVPWKKYSFINMAAAFILTLILVFPYADLFRRSIDADLIVSSLTTPLIYKGDYDAFQMIMEGIRYTDTYGLDYGRQFLGAILFWFPRSLWNNKPVGTGQTIGESLDFSFTNLSAPLWTEVYIGAGIIGIIITFFLYGRLSNWMQKRYMEKGTTSRLAMMIPFLSAYQIYLLRGDFMNGIAYLSLFLICSYGFSKFLFNKPKQINKYEHNKAVLVSRIR